MESEKEQGVNDGNRIHSGWLDILVSSELALLSLDAFSHDSKF